MFSLLRHKVAAYTFSTVLCVLSFAAVHAQTPSIAHRVQAVIPDLRSSRQAHEVDLAFRAFPGVRMCRIDFNTRNLLLELTPDCALTRDGAQELLLPFELSVRCWSPSANAALPYAPLDPRSCAEPATLR